MSRVRTLIDGSLLVMVLAGAIAAASWAVQPSQVITGLLPSKGAATAPEGAGRLCATYPWACAKTGNRVTIDAQMLDVIKGVNSRVNSRVAPVSDLDQYGTVERWALPTARGGDCEDYALLKKKELIAAGVAPEQLLIATVLDRNRQSHAVLIVRTSKQDLVLDNTTGRILAWQQTGYSYLRLQNPAQPSAWLAVLAGGLFKDGAVPSS